MFMFNVYYACFINLLKRFVLLSKFLLQLSTFRNTPCPIPVLSTASSLQGAQDKAIKSNKINNQLSLRQTSLVHSITKGYVGKRIRQVSILSVPVGCLLFQSGRKYEIMLNKNYFFSFA